MKDNFEYYCPVKFIAGERALDSLAAELEKCGSKRPMIVTDPGVSQAGLVTVVLESLRGSAYSAIEVFADVPANSSVQTVEYLASLCRGKKTDALIAVGGGSVLDTAKAVNLLISAGTEKLSDAEGADFLDRPLGPLFAVPTTSGTGSEATLVCVIEDNQKGEKHLITSQFLQPRTAFLDPRMTAGLPPKATAMTAMDAVGHCIEAVYSLARNPFSFSLACTALKLIRDNLKAVIENPQDKESRLNMALAASAAGAAFSSSMVGLAHALAHSSGEVCHLPHGLAVSIFLPAVMEYNLDKASSLLADLLPFVGSEEDLVKTPAALRADKVIAIIKEWREYLYEKTGLARTLSETGLVSETHLEQIASSTLADGSSLYNPRGASVEDCLVLIRKCL